MSSCVDHVRDGIIFSCAYIGGVTFALFAVWWRRRVTETLSNINGSGKVK